MTIRRNYYYFLGAAILVILAIGLFLSRQTNKDEKVFVQAQAVQTQLGWGYNITVGGKVYIHQEFIPAIAGKHGFKSKEDALAVGKRVIEKMASNQLPTITVQDLKELGIFHDSIVSK
ncbi:MAG: DUF4907 domain-containing protein [Bacteroidetes bacterium]|nr:MAG: DUF4907 domain-containing protein [Bacteroidota bacterium]